MLHDLHAWKLCGTSSMRFPTWIRRDSPGTQELWAPIFRLKRRVSSLLRVFVVWQKHVRDRAAPTRHSIAPVPITNGKRGLCLRSTASATSTQFDPTLSSTRSVTRARHSAVSGAGKMRRSTTVAGCCPLRQRSMRCDAAAGRKNAPLSCRGFPRLGGDRSALHCSPRRLLDSSLFLGSCARNEDQLSDDGLRSLMWTIMACR